MKHLLYGWGLLILAMTSNICAETSESWLMRDNSPAPKWDLCYPVGNGTMGAMNLGTYPQDTVYLNNDRMWSHPKQTRKAHDKRKGAIDTSFNLFMLGDIEGGQKAYSEAKGGSSGKGVYQCLGELTVTYDTKLKSTKAQTTRKLNLLTGENITTFKTAKGEISKTILASYPDKCLIIRLESTQPDGLNCKLSLRRPAGIKSSFAKDNMMGFNGSTGETGVRFAARIKVLSSAGSSVSPNGNDLVLQGGKSATIIITSATDHNRDDPLSPRTDNWATEADQQLTIASSKGWKELNNSSIKDHHDLMSRCQLDLGTTPKNILSLPLSERMELIRKGGYDPDLLETFFQFGRHMLVGSSRPGSLPPNLQGIWGVGLRAAWSGDFHLNINAQMNMWPANSTGLFECNEPFFALLKLLHKNGKNTAASVGCRGYAAGLASDVWGFADFVGGSLEWDSTLLGGHWAQEHLMEYYRFTEDKTFLQNVAWPILRDGSLFMLDWMRENQKDGMLIGGPGGSPENKYIFVDGNGKEKSAYINIGNTFTHAIAWETFSDTLECARILGIENDITAKVAVALKRTPQPEVSEDGRIMEWREPFGEVWKGHRHKSHLYGLHPGHQLSLSTTPTLAKAAEKSLSVRMNPQNGDTGGGGRTGWNLAWSANLWARLHRGDKALAMIEEQLRRQVSENLFNHCGKPYQIDGNLGSPAGMAEMLIQSHEITDDGNALIRLLPALPSKWSKGSVQGLHARGGFVVDMDWKNGKLSHGVIRSKFGNKATIVFNDQELDITLKNGETLNLK